MGSDAEQGDGASRGAGGLGESLDGERGGPLVGSRARERLLEADIPVVTLKNTPPSDAEGVRVATMHAMKGLEFRCVALIGVTESALPFQAAVTPAEADRVQHEIDLLSERCLLFVAATRAREALRISWHEPRSPLLPPGT